MTGSRCVDLAHEQCDHYDAREQDVVGHGQRVLEVTDRQHQQDDVGAEGDDPVRTTMQDGPPNEEGDKGVADKAGEVPPGPVVHADQAAQAARKEDGPGQPMVEVGAEPVVERADSTVPHEHEVVVAEPKVVGESRDEDHGYDCRSPAEKQFASRPAQRLEQAIRSRFVPAGGFDQVRFQRSLPPRREVRETTSGGQSTSRSSMAPSSEMPTRQSTRRRCSSTQRSEQTVTQHEEIDLQP